MKNHFTTLVQKMKSPVVTHVAAISAGAIVVAVIHYHMMGNGRTLVLCKDSFNALINDETNFVRFWDDRYEHVFRVSLEH